MSKTENAEVKLDRQRCQIKKFIKKIFGFFFKNLYLT